jgi:hypothetical protein
VRERERERYEEREVFYFLDHCQPSLDSAMREIHTFQDSYKYSWTSPCQQNWKQDLNPSEPELNDQGVLEVTNI